MHSIPLPKLELFLTDVHFPVHDKRVWRLALAVAREFTPDLIWLNGDTLDCAQISRFRTDPRLKYSLKQDILTARQELQRLIECSPKARVYSRPGNHDARIQHFIWDKAEQLSNFSELELPNLLHYDELGITHVPHESKSRIGSLYHLHGDEIKCGSVYPAVKMVQRANSNVIFGHYHKFSIAHASSLGGRVHEAWSIGTIQNKHVDFDYHANWDNGFALVEYTRSGLFHVNPLIVFRDGGKLCVMAHGKLFEA